MNARILLVDGTQLAVAPAHTAHGRRYWFHEIADVDGTVLDSGTSMSTVDDDPDEALTSLLVFLGAFLESSPGSENADLFPEACRSLDADLVAIAAAEREDDDA